MFGTTFGGGGEGDTEMYFKESSHKFNLSEYIRFAGMCCRTFTLVTTFETISLNIFTSRGAQWTAKVKDSISGELSTIPNKIIYGRRLPCWTVSLAPGNLQLSLLNSQ